MHRLHCMDCHHGRRVPDYAGLQIPPECPHCGGLMRPGVVLFGEALPPSFREAEEEARACDVMLVMGTSLNVYPVAGLVPLAKRHGAKLILMNREPTPFDEDADLVIHRELGTVSRELIAMLGLG